MILLQIFSAKADVTLPSRSEAFLPACLLKDVILESDVQKLLASKNYDQNSANTGKAWIAYSDRSNNVTFNGPNINSAKYDKLEFNQKVRIARIENRMALVYVEPKEQTAYPAISNVAQSKGWIPLDHLLLWSSCPANDKGIYYKALLVANVDRADLKNDMGWAYKNPETRTNGTQVKTDMNFYFIMKKENGFALLARQCSMEGFSDQILYSWVNESSYIAWNQRSCLEPNWDPEFVDNMTGKEATFYNDYNLRTRTAGYRYGAENPEDKSERTKFRMPKYALRFPILDNDSGNEGLYKCTSFSSISGSMNVAIDLAAKKEKIIANRLKETSRLNLIIAIDGTKSMEKYYPAVKEAIKQGYSYFGDQYRVRIGLVIYRDYADGEAMIEYRPMMDPKDSRIADFLDKGGAYGIKSSPADKTQEEALFKGIEAALDCEKMGYSPRESNLLLVVGDCGNDLKDTKCLSSEELKSRLIKNNVHLMSFQVRRNTAQPWLLFQDQMEELITANVKQKYGNLDKRLKVRFKEVADGYDLQPQTEHHFYVGSGRFNEVNKDMNPALLTDLMQRSIGVFAEVIQTGTDVMQNADAYDFDHFDINTSVSDKLEAQADSAFLVLQFGKDFFKMLKESNALLAKTSYTKKNDEAGRNYWNPIIYISAAEFNSLLERLEPVNRVAKEGSDNRTPYVNAMKALIRSMLPDITDAEMDQKGTREVMNLIAGLNESSDALKGPSLIKIQDPKSVKPSEFRSIVAEFNQKYLNLRNIKSKGYNYSVEFNGEKYYWIPITDMP